MDENFEKDFIEFVRIVAAKAQKNEEEKGWTEGWGTQILVASAKIQSKLVRMNCRMPVHKSKGK